MDRDKKKLLLYLSHQAKTVSSAKFKEIMEGLIGRGIYPNCTIADTFYTIAACSNTRHLQVRTDTDGTGLNVWLLREDAEDYIKMLGEEAQKSLCVVPISLTIVKEESEELVQ